MTSLPAAEDVIVFWHEAGRDKWFAKDAVFDAAIRERFLALVDAARNGQCDAWTETAQGALALVIVLDQFPRNLFRGEARAFASDAKARAVATTALERGFDRAVEPDLRPFLYMPFMHSEELADQNRCVGLFENGEADNLRAAREHRDIIARFGRFPHRNPTMGRETTREERRFLDEGGFKG